MCQNVGDVVYGLMGLAVWTAFGERWNGWVFRLPAIMRPPVGCCDSAYQVCILWWNLGGYGGAPPPPLPGRADGLLVQGGGGGHEFNVRYGFLM
jgi:hypothetical protein